MILSTGDYVLQRTIIFRVTFYFTFFSAFYKTSPEIYILFNDLKKMLFTRILQNKKCWLFLVNDVFYRILASIQDSDWFLFSSQLFLL